MELQEIYMVHAQPIETLVHRVDYVSRDVAEIAGPDLNFVGIQQTIPVYHFPCILPLNQGGWQVLLLMPAHAFGLWQDRTKSGP